MHSHSILLGAALSLFVFVSTGRAESELPQQLVSFFAFELPEGRSSVRLMNQEDSFAELELSGANSSPYMQVANPDGHIGIYDAPVTGADGVTTYPLLGKIKSSPQWKHVMVILVARKEGDKDRFEGFAFPAAKKDLPPGAIKFANLSPFHVRGILGSSKLIFRPGTIETIKLSEKEGTMVNVIFQYQEGEKWKRMMATQWAVSARERTLVFAFRNPLTGNMSSRSIPLQEN